MLKNSLNRVSINLRVPHFYAYCKEMDEVASICSILSAGAPIGAKHTRYLIFLESSLYPLSLDAKEHRCSISMPAFTLTYGNISKTLIVYSTPSSKFDVTKHDDVVNLLYVAKELLGNTKLNICHFAKAFIDQLK